MPEDYYSILGLDNSASPQDVKRAYRRQALKYHPDKNREEGAEQRFKQVNEAYHVLSDPQRRRRYDKYGHAGASTNGINFGDMGFDINIGGLGDIFESFFGGTSRAQKARKGADIKTSLKLELQDVLKGTTRTIKFKRRGVCRTCEGSGAAEGTGRSTCRTCNGQGRVIRVQRSVFGQYRQGSSCENCNGTGQVVQTPCSNCQGAGIEPSTEQIQIKIPPGVEHGNRMQVSGKGHAGEFGMPPGNLYVNLKVKKDTRFKREGRNLITKYTINVAEAALGGEKKIETLEGDAKFTIKPGTQSGDSVRLSGQGLPSLNSGSRGDLIIAISVEVPTKLSTKQRTLLEQLRDVLKPGAADKPGIFDRVKDAIMGDG